MKFKTFTLGCKVNHYETNAMEKILTDRGHELAKEGDQVSLVVVNTCTVTNLSAAKSRQAIRRAREENPEAVIAVVGCYSQVAPHEIEEIEGVDIILGTSDRGKIAELYEKSRSGGKLINNVVDISELRDFSELPIETVRSMTRAYIKVQDGCNMFCSYCIIPYARGRIRSRSMEAVTNEIRKLAEESYKEIILTGIHVASYGKDFEGGSLIGLVESIGSIKGIERIRLSSLEPGIVDEDFLKRLGAVNAFCPHFHLSLQSGSDSVLKRMNRKYDTRFYKERVGLIRKYFKNAGITTDVIVGFPGETEEEFGETLNFVKAIGFNKIHVFPFSPKDGTPAAKMPDQITNKMKKERAKILGELESEIRSGNLSKMKNSRAKVLIEERKNGYYEGYTESYVRVKVKSEDDIFNEIVDVVICENDGNACFAEIV